MFFIILKKIQFFLFCLIPLFLVTGPFLSDLSISMISLIFIVICIKEKDFSYFSNKFFLFFSLWWLYLLIISFFSNSISLSLSGILFYFRFGFFALSVWYILKTNHNSIKYFLFSLIIVLIIVISDSYLQYFSGKNILGYPYDGIRLSGFFGKEKILGSFVSRIMPLLFALSCFYFKNSKINIIFLMIVLILSDIIIYLSGERVAFFLLFLSSILIILSINRWKLIRFFSLAISLLIISAITFLDNSVKDRMIDSTLSQTNILGDKVIPFSKSHAAHYDSAIKMIKNNFIFGVGPKMFRVECSKEIYYVEQGCSTHPHNTYIQLLVETGIIGTLPIFILFIYFSFLISKQIIMKFFYQTFYLTDFMTCLYICVLLSLWPIMPTGNFFNNWISIIYYLPFGFMLYYYYKDGYENK